MMNVKDTVFSALRIPYKLNVTHDTKQGIPIVFLHGIASNSTTWQYVLPLLPESYRPITIDLLGFGSSPKPNKNNYATKDHAKAVIKTIKKLHLKTPVIIAGHSMGSLVAVEVAKRRPDLVSNLVLVSTPLYTTLDIKRAGLQSPKAVTNGLFNIYNRIILHEKVTLKAAQTIMRLSPNAITFTLSKETWVPFKKSLQNTIMHQSAIYDIASIPTPVAFIYGKLDMLVISKHYDSLASGNPHKISVKSYAGGHMINTYGAKVVAKAINSL